jgi:hypothetical protein
MALTTSTVLIGTDWTLVTDRVAAMVFNDRMEVFVSNSHVAPLETDQGFMVEAGTSYTNPGLQGTRYSPIINTPDVTDHIHNGLGYEVSGTGSLLSGGSYTFVGEVGAIPVHFHNFNVDTSNGPVTVELIENPTITVAGTPVTTFNRNRNSVNIASLAVSGGATVTGGTVLATRKLFSTGTGANVKAGDAGLSGEWDLKVNTAYAIRITAGADFDWAANFFWYEIDLPIV